AALVRELVRAALEAALVSRCGLAPGPAERWVHRGEPPARPPGLTRLRVCDPAVGSGAFLLGALEELTALRRTTGEGPAGVVRRDVLANSLFGVDVKLTAVRLAELRLWLALVADDDEMDVTRIAPLPNLDGHVRQGDALLDPLSLGRALGGGPALMRGALRRLRREGGVPFFAFEAHFGDIVARGGFDIVVGNPPWVRGERLAPQVREALTTRYAAWRPASHRGFAHLPDLAVAFVERALELAAPGGVAALLVPAKLASCGYAEPLRQLLAHGTRIARAAPVEGAAAAFGAAAVYPMSLVAAR